MKEFAVVGPNPAAKGIEKIGYGKVAFDGKAGLPGSAAIVSGIDDAELAAFVGGGDNAGGFLRAEEFGEFHGGEICVVRES